MSVVSAVEYARNAAAYHLLPDLAISCDGPVRSVKLFSRRPVTELDDATVLLTASSRTSVLLLELLCRHRWKVQSEVRDRARRGGGPGFARRISSRRGAGDRRRRAAARGEWALSRSKPISAWSGRNGPGCRSCSRCGPRAGRRTPPSRRRSTSRCWQSRDWGLAHLDELARVARPGRPASTPRSAATTSTTWITACRTATWRG